MTDAGGPAYHPTRPDFFIVGAFKSGTTALYEYLRQHPQVFMPFHKEPLYFGDDLTRRFGRLAPDDYLALFSAAQPGQRVGEASAWYLYSATAAREIKQFSPQAQIIVMVRNPVDVMYAQHSQLLFNASEDIDDFATALDAEPARRSGQRLPSGPIRRENLYYREAVKFATQLERYLQVFERDRVHIIVYDDLRADTAATVRATFRFLRVDESFAPDLSVMNPNKRPRLAVLQRMLYRPPPPVARLARTLRRYPAVHRARAALARVNSRQQPRPELDHALRRKLLIEQAPEIERLGQLIGRDLSGWLAETATEQRRQ